MARPNKIRGCQRPSWRILRAMDSLVKGLGQFVFVTAIGVSALGCNSAEPFHNSFVLSGSGGSGGGAGSGFAGSGGGFDAGSLTGTGGSGAGSGGVSLSGSGGAGGMVATGGSGGSVMTGTGGSAMADGGGDADGARADARSDATGVSVDAPPAAGCRPANWVFTANPACTGAACRYAIDGNATTRYSTGRSQGSAGAESVTLTFSTSVTISGLRLTTSAPGDGPAAYRVERSLLGAINFAAFMHPVVGTGSDNLVITFPPQIMRAIRVTQTGNKAPWWSINEMTITNCH